uniref:Uncharacterized protein n=1 Tax=Anguilla anguilla TaxID=7936 RepID=A0A0E9WYV8_ANGAN
MYASCLLFLNIEEYIFFSFVIVQVNLIHQLRANRKQLVNMKLVILQV